MAIDPQEVSDLRLGIMRLARRLRGESTSTGVTPSQLAVLGSLIRNGPATPSEIAEQERISGPAVTRIIASLAQLGYVSRDPHPEDRRRAVISLTDEAREWIDADRERRNVWLRQRLAELTDDERETLLTAGRIMDRMARE